MSSDATVSSGNVFVDLGVPDAEAALVKSDLAAAIAGTIRQRGLTQAQAAALLGIDQTRVSRIVRGELAHYTIDRLLRFLTLLDRDVTIVVGNEQHDQAAALRVRAG